MEHEFNVLNEPWIPVRLRNGSLADLGIADVLRNAGEISTLAESSPTSYIAIHRMLIAFLVRIADHAQRSQPFSRSQWWVAGIPEVAISEYADRFAHRFWLLHPEYPFMQHPGLREVVKAQKPWTLLASERASGATPTVFDKSVDNAPIPISYAESLKTLLAALHTTPGGLVKVFRTSDNAGPASNCAAIIPLGESLLQTLLMNMPPSRRAEDKDRPYWESEPPSHAELRAGARRLSAGICDRYTWPSRSVLLLRDDTAPGSIRWILYGEGIPIDDDPTRPDPMIAYRIKENRTYKIGFAGARAFWRDLSSLLPNPDGVSNVPPRTIEWACSMLDEADMVDIPLHVCAAGLSTDKAKCLRWRMEHVRIPRRIHDSAEARNLFREAVQQAEFTYSTLRSIMNALALDVLPGSDSKIKREESRVFSDRLHLDAEFFSRLEAGLPSLLEQLDNGAHAQAMSEWLSAIVSALDGAFLAVSKSLGRSSREIRAIVKAEQRKDILIDRLKSTNHDTTQ